MDVFNLHALHGMFTVGRSVEKPSPQALFQNCFESHLWQTLAIGMIFNKNFGILEMCINSPDIDSRHGSEPNIDGP